MIEQLYRQYHQELLGWCSSMTGNRQTAEELVQEAFLRAMFHELVLESMEDHQIRAWLYRTVKNLYVDRVRRSVRETPAEDFPEAGMRSLEMNEIEWVELLESLPDEEGVIVYMTYFQGYHSGEIGKILDMPPGTVRAKLSLARKHLRQALGGMKDVW